MKRWIIITVVFVALLLVLYGCYYAMLPQIGTCQTPQNCSIAELPADAKDISYCIRGAFWPNTCYEFSIDENGYRDWVAKCKDKYSDVGAISGRDDFLILRCDQKNNKYEPLRIQSCLVSQWNFEDEGRYLVYDKNTGRAYYYYHSR